MGISEPTLWQNRTDRRGAKQCGRIHKKAVALGQEKSTGPGVLRG